MARKSQKTLKNTDTNNTVKRTRKTVPRDSPPQRSSIYRGVTRLILTTLSHTLSTTHQSRSMSQHLPSSLFPMFHNAVLLWLTLFACMWFFQTSLDWSVWGSSLGQKLLEWIAEQERKTRFAGFIFYFFISSSLTPSLSFWFSSCWLCSGNGKLNNSMDGCSISRYDTSLGLDNENLRWCYFLLFIFP